ncbi:MAG: 3'(2'),5'-bisphosphate nucleotidase CysQ [Bacteroidales bacterium]|nr:3'(2'),5'-bisphosphate nucleotidase CysQ [Bacteroidales bacterium]MDD4673269.1 3'(2'),5'-bisphosphate nucleotidase CysQ [Bacteroidales bacterium]MDY0347832.1 3'(2'),5'-bisphosphate nucleotidase CysQ [Tenuifilaceae bacterium]
MIELSELKNLLTLAIQTAVSAGKLIIGVYNSDDFQVNLKSDSTPLTLADRLANEEIVNHLRKSRIPVLSEEGRDILYEERKGWEYFWLVDPLDGTKEFIKRNGEFTVNIALVHQGYPIMGVIFIPVLNQLYFSLKDMGAFKLNDITSAIANTLDIDALVKKSVRMPSSDTPNQPYTIVASRSHISDETKNYIEKVSQEKGSVKILNKGSSLKICMVAEGKAHVYPRLGTTTEWDTAAGQAIAEESGCLVHSLVDGNRLIYNKEDIENPWFIVKRND